MRTIHTTNATIPLGHYSQAVEHNGTVYLATQLGRNRETGLVGSVEEQTTNILDSVEAILAAAGSSLQSIIRVTIYLSDIANWDKVNAIYAERLGPHRPARGVIPCGELHNGCGVAMDVVAATEK